VTEAAISSSG